MLAEKYQQLLTAYVDGELGARQRRAVQKLLRRSPEARTLLRKLQEDSNALIHLPAPPPAPDVAASVMQSIAQRSLRPGRNKPRPKHTIPIWAGLAAAAAVLIGVGTASFLLISALSGDPRNAPVVRGGKDRDTKQPDSPAPRQETPEIAKKPDGNQLKSPPENGPPTEIVKVPDRKPDPEKPEKKPDLPESGVIVTAPHMEVFQPGSAEVALPTLLKLRDLGQDSTRKLMLQELARHDAFYMEVLCREAAHAFPRLQSVLQAGGVEVTVDRTAQDRLKQPQFKANYCVYLEDVTPEELTRLLAPLGQEDPKTDRKKPAFGQDASSDANLIFTPMAAEHRRRLISLLGTDQRQAARTTGPLGVDLKKPIAEQTADALAGPAPSASKAEKSAIALAYTPAAKNQPSPEVKRFLDSRKTARKGTLQVLLVLRGKQ